jgi:hypothetical protein
MKYSSIERLHQTWERRHPYNFVCVADVGIRTAAARLRGAAMETLVEFGLGEEDDQDGELEVIEVDDLELHAVQELNTRMSKPVRLAVLRQEAPAGEEASRIAITFRHLFFDGMNSMVFLRRALLRAHGGVLRPLELGSSLRGRDWLMANGFWRVPGLLGRLALDWFRMRVVYARGDGRESPETDAVFVDAPTDLLGRLRREGDRFGATINDVLIARMARALFAIEACGPGRDRDVAVSMAVSLRNGIEPLNPGVCAASSSVYLRAGTDILRSVQRQTLAMKRSRSYMRGLIGVGIGARFWRDPGTGCRASSAYVPSLGMTNVRVPTGPGDGLISRLRAVAAAGPVLPLLVVAVTHSDHMELSLSWRKALFFNDEINILISSLCE